MIRNTRKIVLILADDETVFFMDFVFYSIGIGLKVYSYVAGRAHSSTIRQISGR